MPVPGACYNQK